MVILESSTSNREQRDPGSKPQPGCAMRNEIEKEIRPVTEKTAEEIQTLIDQREWHVSKILTRNELAYRWKKLNYCPPPHKQLKLEF